jgi:hypothetical protein
MSILAAVVQVEAWLFLGVVALIILHRFASGSIDIGEVQLSRLQLLAIALVLAAYYLSEVDPTKARLPDVSTGIPALGGSVFIYIASKLWGRWPDLTGAGKTT